MSAIKLFLSGLVLICVAVFLFRKMQEYDEFDTEKEVLEILIILIGIFAIAVGIIAICCWIG